MEAGVFGESVCFCFSKQSAPQVFYVIYVRR